MAKKAKAKDLPVKQYLVFGSAHLGYDEKILKIMNNIANRYEADAIHLGELSDRFERGMYDSRMNRVRTWDKKRIAAEEAIDGEIASVRDRMAGEKNKDKYLQKLNKLGDKKESLHKKTKQLADEAYFLMKDQESTIKGIIDCMGGQVDFVFNEEGVVDYKETVEFIKSETTAEYLGSEKRLNRSLTLTSVLANGDRVVNPITNRSKTFFRSFNGSVIAPHPVPAATSNVRSGLNQAYNYWTTGSLIPEGKHPVNRITETFKSVQRPSCMLVMCDPNTDYFFCDRINIQKATDGELFAVHDGLKFTVKGVSELPAADKASVITDAHVPYHHPGAVAAFRELNSLHSPETVYDLGDSLDNACFSHWNAHKPLHNEGKRLCDDERLGRLYFKAIACKSVPSIKKRVLVDSNHGEWRTQFIEKYPFLMGTLDIETQAKRDMPDWDVVIRKAGADEFRTFGDITLKHGDCESVKQGVTIYGKYLCGHYHSFQEHGWGSSAGAAASLGPAYLKNRATAWQNQIVSMTKYKGMADKHCKTVLHDDDKKLSYFAYRGEVHVVPFYDIEKGA